MERHAVWRFLFPDPDPELKKIVDRQSMRNIRNICLVVFVVEAVSILIFMTLEGWRFEGATLTSFLNVGFCAVLSLVAFIVSSNMMHKKDLVHWKYLVFKIFFFGVYTLWGISVDMRHYMKGDQMLTFFTVQFLFACFMMFEPWISIIMVSAAYIGMYAFAYLARQAEGIDNANFVILAVLSAFGMCVQFETHLYLAGKEERLKENSRIDALTGLRNRLALEEDVAETYGKPIMAYMIDIDYFKEFNDNYGHVMGDEILKETGAILQTLYPEAHCYRYGGDEFLVLSRNNDSHDYEGSEYCFRKQSPEGMFNVNLSIGHAGGTPESYDEMFDLISQADSALYMVKTRTHSPEHGGHDRRRRR